MLRNYSSFSFIGRYGRSLSFFPDKRRWLLTKNYNPSSRTTPFLALLLAPAVALSSTDDEIQVYNNAINAPGQFGLEIHSNYVAEGTRIPAYEGDAPSYGSFRETSEFSYGLGNDWELGAYLPLLSQGRTTRLEGGKMRIKYLKQEDSGFYYGFNTEVGHTTKRSNEQPWNQELRPIIGYYGEAWRLAFNPVFSWSLVGRDAFLPSFSPMFKVGRVIAGNWVLGVEHFADLGMVHKVEALRHQGQNTYLALDTTVVNVNVNFGVGYGWTQDSDSLTIKMILGLPFNKMVENLFR